MGIAYWLVPYLTGKKLWRPKWAVAQSWIWFVGMLIFSNAMHVVGLLGAPRRTPLGLAPYIPEEWSGHLLRVGIGGGILFIGGYLFIFIVAKTAFARNAERVDIQVPVAEAVHDPQETPNWLDRWVPWIIGTIALLLVAYGPQLIDQIANISLTSPGFKVW
jgi:cytochrome c oxidase subunit 1